MSLSPLLFRSLVRFVASLVREPAASVTTLLYYSQLLPPNVLLERMDPTPFSDATVNKDYSEKFFTLT
ncbi:hypothetical protein ACOSQ3_015548 [Xanthoceras sorbifolium]